jgi:hypothetical protein
MKKNVLFLLAMMVVGVCLADDITVRYDGAAVKVKQKVKDSVTVTDTITVPFSLRRSASLVTTPAFKLGATYTVKTKGYEKTFTPNENFMTIK